MKRKANTGGPDSRSCGGGLTTDLPQAGGSQEDIPPWNFQEFLNYCSGGLRQKSHCFSRKGKGKGFFKGERVLLLFQHLAIPLSVN